MLAFGYLPDLGKGWISPQPGIGMGRERDGIAMGAGSGKGREFIKKTAYPIFLNGILLFTYLTILMTLFFSKMS